jgi:Kef-type K+ transport system membrane component KefB
LDDATAATTATTAKQQQQLQEEEEEEEKDVYWHSGFSSFEALARKDTELIEAQLLVNRVLETNNEMQLKLRFKRRQVAYQHQILHSYQTLIDSHKAQESASIAKQLRELHALHALANQTYAQRGGRSTTQLENVIRVRAKSAANKQKKQSSANGNDGDAGAAHQHQHHHDGSGVSHDGGQGEEHDDADEHEHSGKARFGDKLIDTAHNVYIMSHPSDVSLQRQVDTQLLVDVGWVVVAAAMGGFVASALRLPALVGYLCSGVVVGPEALNLVQQFIQVATLAQFGALFLLFALGVQTHLLLLQRQKKKKKSHDWTVRSMLRLGCALVLSCVLAMGTCIYALGYVAALSDALLFAFGFIVPAFSMLDPASAVAVGKSSSTRSNNSSSSSKRALLAQLSAFFGLLIGVLLFLIPAVSLLQQQHMAWSSGGEEDRVELLLCGLRALAFFVALWFAAKFVWPAYLTRLRVQRAQHLFLLGIVGLCIGTTLAAHRLLNSAEGGAFASGLLLSFQTSKRRQLLLHQKQHSKDN